MIMRRTTPRMIMVTILSVHYDLSLYQFDCAISQIDDKFRRIWETRSKSNNSITCCSLELKQYEYSKRFRSSDGVLSVLQSC